MTEWKTVRHPGYFGKKRDEILASFDKDYGVDNWRIMWEWGTGVIDQSMAWQIYEDAYYEFMKHGSVEYSFLPVGNYHGIPIAMIHQKVAWLINTASNVYDTAETNVQAELSYLVQETINNHVHDVAIRRALLRNGWWFKGNKLVHVRSTDTEGSFFSPFNVPFHMTQMINTKPIEDNGKKGQWWKDGTVEDFYQKNKVLQGKSALDVLTGDAE